MSHRADVQWGMPPLSAYTAFETLIFFQSLVTLDARPASFSTISDALRSNPFVRQNGAFDTDRLSPEALEDLYVTLTTEWLDQSRPGPLANPDQNGHRSDIPGTNPKKRKIASPAVEGILDDRSHATAVPELVSHLYAKYKECVIKEVRNEEKRYNEICDEIERLQREDQLEEQLRSVRDASASVTLRREASTPIPSEPEPMQSEGRGEGKLDYQVSVAPVNKRPEEQPDEPQADKVLGRHVGSVDVPEQSAPEVASPIGRQSLPPPPPPLETAGTLQTRPNVPMPRLPLAVPSTAGYLRPPDFSNGNASSLAPVGPPSQQAQLQNPSPAIPSDLPPPLPLPLPQAGTQTSWPTSFLRTNLSNRPPGSSVIFPPPPSNLPSASSILSPSPMGQAVGRRDSPAAGPMNSSFQQWTPQTPQTPYAHPSRYSTFPFSDKPTIERSASFPRLPPVLPSTERSFQGPYLEKGPATPRPLLFQSSRPDAHGQVTPAPGRYTTPLAPSTSRPTGLSIETASTGSLTPWKKPPRLSIELLRSPGSPVRPRPGDVSPISERAPSPSVEMVDAVQSEEPSRSPLETEVRKPRQKRKKESTPSDSENVSSGTKDEESASLTQARRARSTASAKSGGRSVTSRDDKSPIGLSSATHHRPELEVASEIEAASPAPAPTPEPAPTPTPPPAPEPEAPPKRKRGRPRKRKRSPSKSPEIEPPQAVPSRQDPIQFILCARNFTRTCAPLMNDVAAHKRASIFAKPLTERERVVLGYKSLIYRPQDLKSIKSTIHQGSRAVAAATEAANTPAMDGESPVPAIGASSKNTVLMLQKTIDIIPPKGIVNSAQLEKELIRMFANAVMFNPAPDQERGFGPAFPLTIDGEVIHTEQTPDLDEGGIVRDTREMCDDVEQAVTRWRAAERTSDELGNKSIFSLRRGSASDFNIESADDARG